MVARWLPTTPIRRRRSRYRSSFQRRRLEEELCHANERLEQRVRERTEELVETNQRLQREIAERQLAEEQLRLLGWRSRAPVRDLHPGRRPDRTASHASPSPTAAPRPAVAPRV
jgi:hypothetical protein